MEGIGEKNKKVNIIEYIRINTLTAVDALMQNIPVYFAYGENKWGLVTKDMALNFLIKTPLYLKWVTPNLNENDKVQ